MELKTIINKLVEGTKLLMVQPTMFFRDLSDNTLKTKHMVNHDEVGRPDLIADRFYGDHRMADIILKYNNISDPFSIAEGEILRIPKYTIAYYRLERPVFSESTNIVKTQFTDTKRLSAKDARRIEALKTKYGKDELLPPNVIPTGQKTYQFDGGIIRMGKQAQTAALNTSRELLESLDASGASASTVDAAGSLGITEDGAGTSGTTGTSGNTADVTGGNNTGSDNPTGTGNATSGIDGDSPCAK